MPLTNADYINQLDPTSPQGSDPKSQGDDYLRNIQKAVKQSFPNVGGAVTATHTELNIVDGLTATTTELNKLDGVTASTNRLNDVPIPNGTSMLFVQATAPTGWTQVTTHNDKALRIVSGTGAGTGGSVDFETAFASQTPAGTLNNATISANATTSSTTATGNISSTTLTANQSGLPSHSHVVSLDSKSSGGTNVGGPAKINNVGDEGNANGTAYQVTSTTGGSSANAGHNHNFSGVGHSHNVAVSGGSHNHSFTGTAINLDVKYVNVIICTKDAVT